MLQVQQATVAVPETEAKEEVVAEGGMEALDDKEDQLTSNCRKRPSTDSCPTIKCNSWAACHSIQIVDLLTVKPERPHVLDIVLQEKMSLFGPIFLQSRYHKDLSKFHQRFRRKSQDLTSRVKTRIFQLLLFAKVPELLYIAHDRSQRFISARKLPRPLNIHIPYYDDDQDGPSSDAKIYTLSIIFQRELDPRELKRYAHDRSLKLKKKVRCTDHDCSIATWMELRNIAIMTHCLLYQPWILSWYSGSPRILFFCASCAPTADSKCVCHMKATVTDVFTLDSVNKECLYGCFRWARKSCRETLVLQQGAMPKSSRPWWKSPWRWSILGIRRNCALQEPGYLLQLRRIGGKISVEQYYIEERVFVRKICKERAGS